MGDTIMGDGSGPSGGTAPTGTPMAGRHERHAIRYQPITKSVADEAGPEDDPVDGDPADGLPIFQERIDQERIQRRVRGRRTGLELEAGESGAVQEEIERE